MSFAEPHHYLGLGDMQRSNSTLDSDMCVIEKEDFFVRCVLPIPITDVADYEFMWGVWVSLSRENFRKYVELFDKTDRREESYFGWLCNRVPTYVDTLHLKTNIHLQPHPSRPRVDLELTDHPLTVDQKQGITRDRLLQILHASDAFDGEAG